MTLKIIPNPDKEFLKEITQKVIDNDGFCHCKRFCKVKVEDKEC